MKEVCVPGDCYTILTLSHKHLNRSQLKWEIFYVKEEEEKKIPHKRTITGITQSDISTLYLNALLSAAWIQISILFWTQRRHGTDVRCHVAKLHRVFIVVSKRKRSIRKTRRQTRRPTYAGKILSA